MIVVKEQASAWVRNFNPMSPRSRFPTQAGIYEPLAIYNSATEVWVPWLADAWQWRDPQTLAFTIRDRVQWSDGKPFTTEDVRFTFNLLLQNPALDLGGVSRFVQRVEIEGPRTVVFHLVRPYGPAFAMIAHSLMVPEHVVRDVQNLALWTNPNPVGTGPFTEVQTFQTQVYELGRNPHYWQGPVPVNALRFPAIGSNDQLAMALIQGEIDWAGGFVPQIERVYVAKDPEHHGYWHPTGPTWFLYANTARPPFNDVRVRKALSLGIDRELMLKVAGWSEFVQPDGGTGLSDLFAGWRSPQVEASVDWVHYDPARAGVLLDEAGFPRGADGLRRGANGRPLSFELSFPSGWSDVVRYSQVAAQNLRGLGLDARVRSYDEGAWYASTFAGEFDVTSGWSEAGDTPYRLYKTLMGSEEVRPIGTSYYTNWHRYGSPAMDALLRQFEQTTDRATQQVIAEQMQQRFATEAPAIPLFPGPVWGEYNSERFVGWPNAENPFATLSPNPPFTPLLVLTKVRPRSLRTAQVGP